MKPYGTPWFHVPSILLDTDGTLFNLDHPVFSPQRFHLYRDLPSGFLCIFLNFCYSESEPDRFKVYVSYPFLPLICDLNLGFAFGGRQILLCASNISLRI